MSNIPTKQDRREPSGVEADRIDYREKTKILVGKPCEGCNFFSANRIGSGLGYCDRFKTWQWPSWRDWTCLERKATGESIRVQLAAAAAARSRFTSHVEVLAGERPSWNTHFSAPTKRTRKK